MLDRDNHATAEVGVLTLTVTRGALDFEGRTVYRYAIRHNGFVIHQGDDLRTGVGLDHGPEPMLGTLAAFLAAAVESYPHGENAHLFPPHVVELADGDELSMLAAELEDSW